MIVLFLHGWGSGPSGKKPSFLRSHGLQVIAPELPDHDFTASLEVAQQTLKQIHPDVLVGSSRGGAVAMNIDTGAARLVLLCPAWKVFGSARTVKAGTTILHCPNDCVVPFQASVQLIENSRLPETSLLATGVDHRLGDPESLNRMLWAVQGQI
jgi:hypothetical protein